MRKISVGFFIGLFIFHLPSFANALSREARIKDQLDAHLSSVESSARNHRILQGATGITVGAVLGTAAVITSRSSSTSAVPLFFGITSGLMLASGVIRLVTTSDFEKIPQYYATIPSGTPDELALKVGRGENYLDHLASVARTRRYSQATIDLALGALSIGWYAAEPRIGSFFLYQGIFFSVTGLVPLFFESEAEIQNKNFREWKEEQKFAFQWNLVPLPSGAAAFVSLQF